MQAYLEAEWLPMCFPCPLVVDPVLVLLLCCLGPITVWPCVGHGATQAILNSKPCVSFQKVSSLLRTEAIGHTDSFVSSHSTRE